MHIGLFFFGATLLIAGMQKVHAYFQVKKRPELRDDYNKLVLGFIVFMGLPWLVMEIGELATSIPGILFFFRMRDRNPFVLAFFICLLIEYGVYFYWIWFRDGATFLYNHPLLFLQSGKFSPLAIKIMSALQIGGGIFALVVLWQLRDLLYR